MTCGEIRKKKKYKNRYKLNYRRLKMAKKKKDTMAGTTIGGIVGLNVVGAMPSSGMAGETTLRTNFSTGVGNVGTALPVMGKVKGTKMVIKSLKKLKPIKFKGGYKI